MKVIKANQVPKEATTSPLFIGNVARQQVTKPGDSGNFNMGIVHFSAGSRNKRHKHTTDQLVIITEGAGVFVNDHETFPVTVGDVVIVPAGEDHWHGAPGATPMSHIAITAIGCQSTITEKE